MQWVKYQKIIEDNLLVSATTAFATGIFLSSYLTLPTNLIFPIFALFVGIFLLIYFFLQKHIYLSLILLICVAGFLHASVSNKKPSSPNHIYNLIQNKTKITAIGILHSAPSFDGRHSRFNFKISQLAYNKDKQLQNTTGIISLKLKHKLPKHINPGDTLAIRATVDRPNKFLTPGSFDYPLYLSNKNIWITGYISSPKHLSVIKNQSSKFTEIRYYSERLRLKIGNFIDDNLDYNISGLYKAILIGDRRGIAKNVLENFKYSGVMHILAISGLHVSILATFIFTFFYWLLKTSHTLTLRFDIRKIAASLSIPPLCFYALLSGANLPVIRALIMTLILIMSLCVYRTKKVFPSIALAALIILIYKPSSLATASFQLSFAAIISIGLMSSIIRNLVTSKSDLTTYPIANKFINWLKAAFIVAAAAITGTAPFLLFYFNRLSLLSFISTLIIEPMICLWSLSLGFIAIPFIFIVPEFAIEILKIGSLGLYAAQETAAILKNIPYTNIWLPTPSKPLIAIFFCLIIYFSHNLIVNRKNYSLSYAIFILVIFFTIYPISFLKRLYAKNTIVSFMDVGQGSSTLLQLPYGKNVIIDAGGAFSPNFDVGENVISKFLWHKGIKKINTIVITHSDSDHYNGMPFIVDHFKPSNVWVSSTSGNFQRYSEILEKIEKQGITINIPETNSIIYESGNAQLVNLRDFNDINNSTTTNDQSLVLLLKHNDFRCIFPGDITTKVEQQLIEKSSLPKADFLLAAHHGSATSNSVSFIKAISPKKIIVSAGRFNKHFPSEKLSEICKELKIELLITSRDGTVELKN